MKPGDERFLKPAPVRKQPRPEVKIFSGPVKEMRSRVRGGILRNIEHSAKQAANEAT